MSNSKQGLKLFNTLPTPIPLSQGPPQESKDINSSPQEEGTHRWGLFFAATHTHSLPIERLLLKTINAELGIPGSVPDPYAAAFRAALLPSWRYKLAASFLAKQYKSFVESAACGVPGLLTYLDARARWVDGHITSAAQEGVQQVVVLGGGFDTRALRLGVTLTSLKFFEVDEPQIINKKKALLADVPALLRRHLGATAAANIPTPSTPQVSLIPLEWSNPNALVPSLTAAGFQPGQRTVIILEGLYPHLTQAQVDNVLADAAALCAPGSKILWDFLHLDAFDGSNRLYAGYASLSAACANKGAPFRSGQAPGFSAWVRATQRLHLRIQDVLSPQDIAARLVRPAYEVAASSQASSSEGWGNRCNTSCLAPKLSSAGTNNGAPPMTLPLPQFYSLVAAVKTVPRISLKDSAPAPAMGAGVTVPRAPGSNEAWGADGGSSTGASCFIRGLVSMIWGYDTSEDEEIPQRAKPQLPRAKSKLATGSEPKPYPSPESAIDKQRSADWSLAAARQEAAASAIASPSSSVNSPSKKERTDFPGAITNDSGVARESRSSNALEHAISLPVRKPPTEALPPQQQQQQEENRGSSDNPKPTTNNSSWWSWFD